MTKTFADFEVGDYAYFSRKFTAADFEQFSRLSGDTNALHHDASYASRSEFEKPIVPLHLTLAPLSAIAGMIFPGEPSLYLGHRCEAIAPVYYDEEITYSARVSAINAAKRVLSLSVIAFRDTEVVLRANMEVTVRETEWSEEVSTIRRSASPRTALITGASGGIGSATAIALARAGWNLLLHYRSNEASITTLADECRFNGAQVALVKGSLTDAKFVRQLADAAAIDESLALIVHTASAGIRDPLEDLTASNYVALKVLSNVVLPRLLKRQQGGIILLGSAATQHHPRGWEDYVAAKSMAQSYLAGLNKRYAEYGVRCSTVAPTYVATAFSKDVVPNGASAILPEEVAEAIVQLADAGSSAPAYVTIDASGVRELVSAATSPSTAPPEPAPQQSADTVQYHATSNDQALEALVRKVLKLGSGASLSSAELGVTAGWDSLRHIELLLEIERSFGINCSSEEIDRTTRYSDLAALVHSKTQSSAKR